MDETRRDEGGGAGGRVLVRAGTWSGRGGRGGGGSGQVRAGAALARAHDLVPQRALLQLVLPALELVAVNSPLLHLHLHADRPNAHTEPHETNARIIRTIKRKIKRRRNRGAISSRAPEDTGQVERDARTSSCPSRLAFSPSRSRSFSRSACPLILSSPFAAAAAAPEPEPSASGWLTSGAAAFSFSFYFPLS